VKELLEADDLASGYTVSKRIMDSIKTSDSVMDFLLRNFVILPKRLFKGISGHVCNNCLTFQFSYARDIGYDLTAAEWHRCSAKAVAHVNTLQDKGSRLDQIYSESTACLVNLTKSLFSVPRSIVVDSSPSFDQYFRTRFFHGPVITMDAINPSYWEWTVIQYGTVDLTDDILQKFIKQVWGTYAVISIRTGNNAGNHLIHVTRKRPPARVG